MSIFDTDTGENLGQIGDIKEVNMTSEYKTDFQRDKHNNIVSRFSHDPTYTITFNTDEPINTEDFYKILGINTSNMPDAYDIQFVKFVQARRHKKRRINKKWLKKYGCKQILVNSKGWMMKHYTDGRVEFVKK